MSAPMALTPEKEANSLASPVREEEPVAHVAPRRGLGKISMVFACGTALFSDGYQNGVVGSVNTMLKRIYGAEVYGHNNYGTLFSSMAFAGTVVGMLTFGYIADKVGRKSGMILATLIVAVFTVMLTGAYGSNMPYGMFQALIAYRFLTGIGIGAEYPAGSVAASENTENPEIKKGTQHMLFALSTNVMIDFGFVISAFVPYLLVVICKENHLRLAWRLSFGIGIIPPLLVLFWRFKMSEPERFKKDGMRDCATPYWLIWKRYWRSFVGLSLCWFCYDLVIYPFGLYSSTILDVIIGDTSSLAVIFGWNTVINLFYIPGCVLGALTVDRLKPKRQMIIMLLLQAVFGFFMSGFYGKLIKHVAGFTVMYGLFLSFGEAGPGDCLGLLASKLWPTAIRGQAYGLAAAVGKIGAFVGTWAFPAIIDRFPAGDQQTVGPFWIGSGIAILSALILFFLVPEVHADHMSNEDAEFRKYLEANGFDTSKMGLKDDTGGRLENLFAPESKAESVYSTDKKDNGTVTEIHS